MFLLIPLLFGHNFLSYRLNYGYTNVWSFIHEYSPVKSLFLFPWANFDGIHYLSIAGDGYTKADSRFFPLFPLIIHQVSSFLGGGKTFGALQFFVGLFIANTAFFISLIMLYKLIRFDFPKNVAIKSLFFMLVFPASFFFASIYSESLFLLLSLLSFYFARKKQWAIAAIFGILLSATRLAGIAIFPVLLYEFFSEEKHKSFLKIFPLCLVPLGFISYMMFNLLQWGNAFYFLTAQGSLSNGRSVNTIVFPFQTLFRYMHILISVSFSRFEWRIALLELLTFVLISFLLYVSFLKKIRFSYILYSLICFLIPVLSGTFSGLPRYVLLLFPVFITLSLIEKKRLIFIYSAVSIILLFILTMLFARGYFIA